MKKFICALMFIVLLTGCGVTEPVRAVSDGVSYRAHIFYYGKEYDYDVRICDGMAEYTFKGGLIDGFKSVYTKDGVSLYCGDKKGTSYKTMPCTSLTEALFEMNEFLKGEYNAEKKDGDYVVEGNTSLGKFELKMTESGLPLNCSLSGEDFYVEFYDVNIIK